MNLQTKPTKSRHALRFRFRGREVALERFSPRRTVLDWLREDERATGTKEGCAEGDCGACTVVLARLRRGKLTYEAFNACILLLGQLDGAELITVEDLAHGQTLHPVQQAMVDHHASQCGFCTPGIVMSLFAAYHSGAPATAASLCDQLAGNLCRCTGYRPILVAGLATCDGAPTDRFAATAAERAQALAALADDAELFVGDESQFFAAPASLDSLAAVYQRFPDATLVAGATDVGLWVTKLLRDLKRVIWLGRVDGLDAIAEIADGELSLGAGVTLRRSGAAGRDDPSGSKRTDAPLRFDPGAGQRHCWRQHRERLSDRRSCARVHCARRHGCPAKGRRDPQAAAGGLLHRLRQAGPHAGGICAGDRVASPRGGPALPRIQGLETLR